MHELEKFNITPMNVHYVLKVASVQQIVKTATFFRTLKRLETYPKYTKIGNALPTNPVKKIT